MRAVVAITVLGLLQSPCSCTAFTGDRSAARVKVALPHCSCTCYVLSAQSVMIKIYYPFMQQHHSNCTGNASCVQEMHSCVACALSLCLFSSHHNSFDERNEATVLDAL
jgi:hypothetical protein